MVGRFSLVDSHQQGLNPRIDIEPILSPAVIADTRGSRTLLSPSACRQRSNQCPRRLHPLAVGVNVIDETPNSTCIRLKDAGLIYATCKPEDSTTQATTGAFQALKGMSYRLGCTPFDSLGQLPRRPMHYRTCRPGGGLVCGEELEGEVSLFCYYDQLSPPFKRDRSPVPVLV